MSGAPVIAIDGPSASGKGTIASRVAKTLGFHYLESGALYRLIALLSLREDTLDEQRLAVFADEMDVFFDEGEITLGEEPVTEKVRSEVVGNRASEVARLPQLRHALLRRQRAFRRPPGLVADGRDMGTIVFPQPAQASAGGESFAALFEESLNRKEMRVGEVITAEVLSVDDNWVVVNAGLKSESIIPAEEFKNDTGQVDVKPGDFVSVSIEALEDSFGATRLSADKAKRMAAWLELEKSLV